MSFCVLGLRKNALEKSLITIENERSVLGNSLQHVRFPILESSVFTETVAVTDILTMEEEIDVFRSICSSKVESKRFPTSERKTCQDAFGWAGAYLNTDSHTFNAKKPFILKGLILNAPSRPCNLRIRFTSAKNSDLGSLGTDYEYEIECSQNDHNSYFLVCLPNNGINIQRQTSITLEIGESSNVEQKGKIKLSCIFTAIKNDKRLKSMFCLDDTSTSLPIKSAFSAPESAQLKPGKCSTAGGFGQTKVPYFGEVTFGAVSKPPNSQAVSCLKMTAPSIKAYFFQF